MSSFFFDFVISSYFFHTSWVDRHRLPQGAWTNIKATVAAQGRIAHQDLGSLKTEWRRRKPFVNKNLPLTLED
jgi:hypothetical protein